MLKQRDPEPDSYWAPPSLHCVKHHRPQHKNNRDGTESASSHSAKLQWKLWDWVTAPAYHDCTYLSNEDASWGNSASGFLGPLGNSLHWLWLSVELHLAGRLNHDRITLDRSVQTREWSTEILAGIEQKRSRSLGQKWSDQHLAPLRRECCPDCSHRPQEQRVVWRWPWTALKPERRNFHCERCISCAATRDCLSRQGQGLESSLQLLYEQCLEWQVAWLTRWFVCVWVADSLLLALFCKWAESQHGANYLVD